MRKPILLLISLCSITSPLSAEIVTSLGTFPVTETITSKKELKGKNFQEINHKKIEETNKNDLSSLLKSDAQLAIKQAGGIGAPTYIEIRGLKHRYGSVFYNNINLNDPSALDNASWIDGFLLDDIEKVQIVKGPHFLKSPDPVLSGGIILEKAKPKMGWHIKTREDFGSHGLAHQHLTTSYADTSFDFLVGGTKLVTKGHEKLQDQFKEKTRKEYKNNNANIASTIKPSDHFQCGFSNLYQHENQNIDNRKGWFHDHLRHKLFLSRSEAEFSFLKDQEWIQKIAINHAVHERHYHSYKKNPYSIWGKKTTFEYQSIFTVAEDYILDIGGDKVIDKANIDKDFKKNEHRNGVYTQLNLKPIHWLQSNAGIRYYEHLKGKASYSLSNQIELIEKNLFINTSFARGFKRPSFFELYDKYSGNPDLCIEENRAIDAGITSYFWNQHLKIEANVFLNKIIHPLAFDYITYKYNTEKNYKTKGIELGFESQLFDPLKISLYYQHVQNRQTYKGLKPLTPRNVIRTSAELTPIEKMTLCVYPRYQSKYISGPEHIKGNFVLDSAINYNIKEYLKLHGKIENMFNKKYSEVYDSTAPGLSFTMGFTLKI
jgi:vitamin B12 transporter